MLRKGLIISGITLLTCGAANAQMQANTPMPSVPSLDGSSWDQNFTVNDSLNFEADNMFLPEKAQTYHFGGKGRWQMDLETVTRVDDSPLPREEMRAGATYNFTPRFSLGGSVSFGAEELDNVSNWKDQNVEAGVQLKTTFKF